MRADRRDILKASSFALLGTAFLSRVDKVDGMQQGPASVPLAQIVQSRATGVSEKLLIGPTPGAEGPPQPATVDRLPLAWNKRQVGRFKEKLSRRGVDAFLVRDRWNIMYLTGYWHTSTERPQATYMNKDDADPWFLYPGLDRDSVSSWWFGGGWQYFDVKEAEGAFPNLGTYAEGKTVDLFQLLLEGIKKHGVQGNKIGLDGEFYPQEAARAKEILPGIEWVNVSDMLLDMREVKTPEELALCRRAFTYFDRAHAYARDYILTFGTSVTDYEVAAATSLWINDILYSELKLEDGALHHGVASEVEVGCRVGPLCAYPHPNQPLFNRIQRNMPLQVEGGARIGGQGGENYRMFILADGNGNFDGHMQKLWEVSQHCCDMQVEMQKAGVTCSSIAYAIHKYQVESGVAKYVYHRPAHGQGSEGHQPPYLSLGDHSVLKLGMTFSEEPGLFDPQGRCGFNWSDCVVTAEKSGYRMSGVPYSKEWCWIKL